MIEILAAICGASVTAATLGIAGGIRQSQQGRDSLVRLATAVDGLTNRLDVLHTDIKSKDAEVFARLRDLESAVARLEGPGGNH